MEQFHKFSHRIFAVILVLAFWWVPIGLHRIWMRQQYWWLYTLGFGVAIAANQVIFGSAANQNLAMGAYIWGVIPPLTSYQHYWVLGVVVPWVALWIYDCIAVWFWRVPGDAGHV